MASPNLLPNLVELSPEDQQLVNSGIETRTEKSDATSLSSKSEEEIKNLLPEPPPSSQTVVPNGSESKFTNVSITGTTTSVTGVVESYSTGKTPVKYPYFRPLYLIEGTSESDYLTDTRNNDLILARGGDDYVIAWRGGSDQIYGEEGNDFLFAGAGDDYVYGGNGNDRVYGSSGNDFLYGDSIYYYPPYLTLDTASVANTATLDTTQASFDSSLSKPYPSVTWGDDRIYGGTGNDYIYGGGGNDYIEGGSNDDVIYGDSGNNYSYSYLNAISPYPYTVGGNDTIKGGSGNDIIYGEDANDSLYGGSGNDSIYGGSGNDNIYGESGNDYLDGGSSKDQIDGGDGNDTIVGSNQTFFWSYVDTPILNSTDTSVAAVDTPIAGSTGISVAAVAVSTGKTANITAKVVSADNLELDLTKKILPIEPPISDSDQDVLTGGKGADKFVFYDEYSGVDAIADFNSNEGDQIQVSRSGFSDGLFYAVGDGFTKDIDNGLIQEIGSGVTKGIGSGFTKGVASGLTLGILKEEQFTLGTSASDASDRFIYNNKTGDLFFDRDGNGSQKQVQFAQLSGAPNLTYKDIFII
ncbi:hypothetical protein NIES2100_46870 [Calothrix sp. NIES-2100]|uniref:calcium-binding protein n=1 Tax=Calothrix sp. NIES-2100 TaxID=1954172 RepID=UPI000B5F00EF|nr:hypothetical protein NIES2100_46870 [Calothrix sp. NIES-2100]